MSDEIDNNGEDAIDPYLWDRSGPPDPETARLERLLAPLAHAEPLRETPPAPAAPPTPITKRRNVTWIGVGVLAAAAAALLLVKTQTTWLGGDGTTPTIAIPNTGAPPSVPSAPPPSCMEQTPGAWAFHAEGAPARCGNVATNTGWMVKDEVLETPPSSKATLDVATLGTVTLEPNTKLRLLGAEGQAQKLDLLRGTVHARINAPPRLFIVKTPIADAVDLGCEYTLTVDEQGAGRLAVSYGAVSLERPSHAPTLVTQGTWCPIGARGPGTPLATTASESLRRAAEDLDSGEPAAFDRLLRASTKADTLTLWHVMRRNSPDERGRAYDRLASFVPPPKAAPRDAVVHGEHAAIAAYRDALSTIWYAPR